MNMYRQGDILLTKIDDPNLNDRYQVDASGIVLYGETTGHRHALAGPATLYRNKFNENDMFVQSEGSQLVHEEHDVIELEQGWFRITRQREYDEGEIRYVRD